MGRIDKSQLAHPVKPRKKDRTEEREDEKHSAFIRSLGVCIGAMITSTPCSGGIESCHIRAGFNCAGKKPKASEVPMCSGHHRTGPKAQHKIGEKIFFGVYHAAAKRLGKALWKNTGDKNTCLQLIKQWKMG